MVCRNMEVASKFARTYDLNCITMDGVSYLLMCLRNCYANSV